MRPRRIIFPMILMVLILLTVAGVKQLSAQSSIKPNPALWLLLLLSDSGGQPLPTTTRVSVSTAGVQGNNSSDTPSISSDGRYVIFDSLAGTLVDGDTYVYRDIFVRDRQTGQTSRVSISTGGALGNNHSYSPSISADGRCVAFESLANNLVDGDNNGFQDIFVHDRY